MQGKELENIMLNFVDKKIDVLISTTILESGIDIPNANTIIVENADKLGLAGLYQIKGRVGRSTRQAYAYITYKKDKLITEIADKRLRAIKEFTQLGSGFKIAMRDLEIRGARKFTSEKFNMGILIGVGYETYCKLLDEVVKSYKGIKIKEEQDIIIDINISTYIPDAYINSNDQKIETYQNISLCKTEKDMKEQMEEIKDRYGKIPQEIKNLFEAIRIKELCKKTGIIKINQKENNVLFHFDPKNFTFDINKMVKKYKDKIKFSPNLRPYITYKLNKNSDIIKEIKEFLNDNNK